ncbi:PTS sugar transporter subunit IIA [Listeria costaricensis]|uniref:PTS sugar transporter subunit IIA n=1 Tax=Listeria costaricensis TaxID=2026604 RepID=UPI001F08ED01|nr:PTS glucose transporter subunit IIA [Listeria costaricensis]
MAVAASGAASEPTVTTFQLNDEKTSEAELVAPADGEVIPITEVPDPVFSQKMMGDGFAVRPTSGQVVSPVSGQIISIFDTKHAIGFKLANGLEILLHMGIDTVDLGGTPFTLSVQPGDNLEAGQKLGSIDLSALQAAEKGTDLIVVITNMDQVEEFNLMRKGQATAGQNVAIAIPTKH